MANKEFKSLVELLQHLNALPDEQTRLLELSGIIYRTIPEMFDDGVFEPRGVEIYAGSDEPQKIYAWSLAEGIARKLLGMEVKKGKGRSWVEAQSRAGYI
jgi:hypothetical protein